MFHELAPVGASPSQDSSDPDDADDPDDDAPKERLQLSPYYGPKSHHASRAFADMSERKQRRKRKRKMMVFALGLVVLTGAALFAALRVLL